MHLSNNMAPVIIQAIQDAIKFNQDLLNSETLKNIEEHEEYLMTLGYLLTHIQDEYKKQITANIIQKRKSELEDVKKRALNDPDGEPSGKLTSPSDIDRIKDRKIENK
ncbi:hypothetical protein [Sessilibacter corallicola]|uniref:hypothetical protein n=1 Tax=Sessilibacter corallicola TaxID=2904075 RepID=UPI001E313E9A|nr:hypothetical protein [Sessilibacter corallicola]MCE2027311.1 hypothetical protein [Sessilibacter corallicola]